MSIPLKPLLFGDFFEVIYKLLYSNIKKILIINFIALLIGLFLTAIYYLFINIIKNNNYLVTIIIGGLSIFFIIFFMIYYSGILTDLFINSINEKIWSLKKSFNFINNFKAKIFISGLIYVFFNYVVMIILYLPILLIMRYDSSISNFNIFIQICSYCILFPVNVLCSLAIPIIIFENMGPIKSIKRSINLIKKDFWSILGINFIFHLILLLIIVILLIGFGILIAIGVSLNISFSTFSANSLIIIFIGLILSIITTVICSFFLPLLLGLHCIVYFNQRIRHESFGMEILVNNVTEESMSN